MEFAVHLDYKYHMGATVTMGKVVIVSIPQKKTKHKEYHGCGVSLWKLRVKSNTMDQSVLEAQWYNIKQNSFYQDNKSNILLQ